MRFEPACEPRAWGIVMGHLPELSSFPAGELESMVWHVVVLPAALYCCMESCIMHRMDVDGMTRVVHAL